MYIHIRIPTSVTRSHHPPRYAPKSHPYLYVSVGIYVYTCICMCIYIHIQVYTYSYVYEQTLRHHLARYAPGYHSDLYVSMCIYVYISIFLCNIYIYKFTYIAVSMDQLYAKPLSSPLLHQGIMSIYVYDIHTYECV